MRDASAASPAPAAVALAAAAATEPTHVKSDCFRWGLETGVLVDTRFMQSHISHSSVWSGTAVKQAVGTCRCERLA